MHVHDFFLRFVVAVVVLVSVSGCAHAQERRTPSADDYGPPDARPTFTDDDLARAIHDRVNDARRKYDLPVLAWNDTLATVARRHSADMARRDYFAHRSPAGTSPTERAARAGYSCRKTTGELTSEGVGENLFVTSLYSSVRTVTRGPDISRTYAWKPLDTIVEEIVAGWLDSPPHRENLVEPHYDRQGIGVAVTDEDRIYVTQNLC